MATGPPGRILGYGDVMMSCVCAWFGAVRGGC